MGHRGQPKEHSVTAAQAGRSRGALYRSPKACSGCGAAASGGGGLMHTATASRLPVRTLGAAARFEGEAEMLSNGISWPDLSEDTEPIRQPARIEPPRPDVEIRKIGNEATPGPRAVLEQDDHEVPDDEPPSLGAEARVARPVDELVLRCLRDLIDDWERKGGRLSYDDVTRLTTKRGLNGHQLASLLDGLAQAGITPGGLQPNASHPAADTDNG